jgi:hypothetical protein
MSPAQKVNAESDREKRRVIHRVKYARDLEREVFRLIADDVFRKTDRNLQRALVR